MQVGRCFICMYILFRDRVQSAELIVHVCLIHFPFWGRVCVMKFIGIQELSTFESVEKLCRAQSIVSIKSVLWPEYHKT